MSNATYMKGMLEDETQISNEQILNLYASQPQTLRNAVAGMTADQIRARPIAGKWSTIELVAHLAGCELLYADRIERTLAMEKPLLMGIDERPYPTRLAYQSLDLEEELALIDALRRHLTRVLRAQTAEGWERVAVHSEVGLINVRRIALHATRHINHHLPFLVEKRKALGL